MHNKAFVDVTLSIAGSPAQSQAGTMMIFDRLEIASKVKPIFSITFDQVGQLYNGQDIFTELIVPIVKNTASSEMCSP